MRVALEAAVRIGNRHAEMFAANSMGMCLTAAGRYAEAVNVQAKALAHHGRSKHGATKPRSLVIARRWFFQGD